eukprot:COSAG06_NODE_3202_length_5693_cov_3.420272_4_plen_125_part_00
MIVPSLSWQIFGFCYNMAQKSAPFPVASLASCEKCHSFFECFPYVCPEPVLVKCSFLYINGAKSGVFRTAQRPVGGVIQRTCRNVAFNLSYVMVVPRLPRQIFGFSSIDIKWRQTPLPHPHCPT